MDTRSAIFREGKILLVREKNSGLWSMPGGWVDVNLSVRDNAVKEVREEAGLEVEAVRLIALHDRNRHNPPPYAYGICKIFILCEERAASSNPIWKRLKAAGSGGMNFLPWLWKRTHRNRCCCVLRRRMIPSGIPYLIKKRIYTVKLLTLPGKVLYQSQRLAEKLTVLFRL